jgi:hypothetical protein
MAEAQGIDHFIELANDCPNGYNPLDLDQQVESDPQRLKKYLAEELKTSDELKRIPRYAKCDAFELKMQLRVLWGVKNTLSRIVSAIGRPRKARELRLVPIDLGTATGHWIIVGRDGSMNVVTSQDHQEFIDALTANDARRIRQCYCGRFFYARRTTKRFHKDKCRVANWADTHIEQWLRIQKKHQEKRAKKRNRAEPKMKQSRVIAKPAPRPRREPGRGSKSPRRTSRAPQR